MGDPLPSSSVALLDHLILLAPSPSSYLGAARDDTIEEDACSICLEPFTSLDPSTVTSCKHEYHLQCILEWSQRSKECPICAQKLVLQDPSSQELLVAVEAERKLRPRSMSRAAPMNLQSDDLDLEDSGSDDSDLDEHIMRHLAAAVGRARHLPRRERQRLPGLCPSQPFVISPTVDGPNQQPCNSAEGSQNESSGIPEGYSPAPGVPTASGLQPVSSLVYPDMNVNSGDAVNGDSSFKPRVCFKQPPSETAQGSGSGSSDPSSFSSTVKSKWSLASARYKDSITKGARGIKEKLAARNNSVKELSKGVQREMSAGIASVARMMERLDLTPKRNATSSPGVTVSGSFSLKGKGLQETTITETIDKASMDNTHITTSPTSSHVSDTISSQPDLTHVQSGP